MMNATKRRKLATRIATELLTVWETSTSKKEGTRLQIMRKTVPRSDKEDNLGGLSKDAIIERIVRELRENEVQEESESKFVEAVHKDPTVRTMFDAGAGMGDIVGALVQEKERLRRLIFELESIAPRKIVLPDGTAMVWNCPPELLPESRTMRLG